MLLSNDSLCYWLQFFRPAV